MRVQPITDSTNDISYKGSLSKKTAEFTKSMSDRWIKAATDGKYKTLPIINTCIYASSRINNVFLNLSTMMERFCHGCELTFAKSEKSGSYRFFIEHKHSNYKSVCGDFEFSPNVNKLTDVSILENVENKLAKLNPYKENSNFIIQRKADSTNMLFDKEFEPDADYLFWEDKLIRREASEATMEDINEFLDAAKEEGLIDG